jgi:hypothetical protein
MRRPCTFRKSDVTRVTKAVHATGLGVARVEVRPDGLIIVVPANVSNSTEAKSWKQVCDDDPGVGAATLADNPDLEVLELDVRHGQPRA